MDRNFQLRRFRRGVDPVVLDPCDALVRKYWRADEEQILLEDHGVRSASKLLFTLHNIHVYVKEGYNCFEKGNWKPVLVVASSRPWST